MYTDRMSAVPLALLTFLIVVAAKDEQSHLVPLHSIIPQQYELILNLTNGRPIISEGRFIVSGLAAVTGLATGFTAGIATSLLPKIFSRLVEGNSNQLQQRMNTKNMHPSCIIDNNDNEIHKKLTKSLESPQVNCVIVIQSGINGISDQKNLLTYSIYEPVTNFSPDTYFNGLQWYEYYPYYANSYYSQSSPISNFDQYRVNRKNKQLGMRNNLNEDRRTSDGIDNIKIVNYAKISKYPIEGYRTVKYPQTPYQSNYPKLVYTHAVPDSVPVYIKTTYKGNNNDADIDKNYMLNN